MVTFYKGNTLDGITRRILGAIDPTKGGNHVVLVPDRNTLSREEAVLRALGGSLVNVEILTFARLAVRVLGVEAQRCLTPEACTILLAKALLGCRGDLAYYNRSVETDGFANEMYSSLVAVRNSGVTPEGLRAAAQRMAGRTSDKTRDMATIYSAYLAQLADRVDPTSRLQMLARRIPDSDYIAHTHFYIIDFYAFNPVQYRVLGALMQCAAMVHIGYIDYAPWEGADRRQIYNLRIYPHALRATLRALARRAGHLPPEQDIVDCSTPLLPYKHYMQDALFGYARPYQYAVGEGQAAIRLFYQSDATAEIRTVCAEIRALLRQGYRYRDIAIVCADPDGYWNVMRNVFHEYDIPFFADRRTMLSQMPICTLLLDMARCVARNCDFDMVMRIVKNPLFGVDPFEAHIFENYCRRYGVKYSIFLRPFGLGAEEERAVPEKVRARLAALLPTFAGCDRVAHYVDALWRMLEGLDYVDAFNNYYLAQRQMGFVEDAAITYQVPARLKDLLDMLVRLVGDTPCDLDLFLRLLQSALGSVKIALLPQSADCVYIGDALDSRYDNVAVMFVVGAQQGKLPADPAAGSILSDTYVHCLAAQSVVIKPGNREQYLAARFYLVQLLLTPSDALYVSYTAHGFDAKPQYPSSLVDSLSQAFAIQPTCGLSHDLVRQIATRRNAYKVLLRTQNYLTPPTKRALLQALTPEDRRRYMAIPRVGVTPLTHAAGLFFRRDLTSISQLENYFACPYQHFVKYGLRASQREEADANTAETGTMLHRVMELFFSRHTASLDAMDAATVDAHIVQCVAEAFAETRFAGDDNRQLEYARLLAESRIVLALEIEQVRRSQFKPVAFEVEFGRAPYPPIDLGSVRLRGKIDRIDRCGDLVSVIDYKSGKVDYYELKYVYYGTKIQLYAYLDALRNMPDTIPVGGFYKRLSGDYKRENDKNNLGWLLGQVPIDHPAWLNLMDPTLPLTGSSDLVPVCIDKGGAYKAATHMTATYPQMCAIMDYVHALMQNAVAEVNEGNIMPSPLEEECKYCLAHAMCPMGRSTPARKQAAMGVEAFDIGKMEDAQ